MYCTFFTLYFPPSHSSTFSVNFHLSKVIHPSSCFFQPPPCQLHCSSPQLRCSDVLFFQFFFLSIFSPCLCGLCPVLHRAATTAPRLLHKLHVASMSVLPVCTQCPKNPTCPWEQLAWLLKFCTIRLFPELLNALDSGHSSSSTSSSSSPACHLAVSFPQTLHNPAEVSAIFSALSFVVFHFTDLILQADSTFSSLHPSHL